jgi:hypothetical protein
MARCTGSPALATAVRTVTLSRSCRTEPQASLSLPKASDTPASEAAGMVVTEMNTPIKVPDRDPAVTLRWSQPAILYRHDTALAPAPISQLCARLGWPAGSQWPRISAQRRRSRQVKVTMTAGIRKPVVLTSRQIDPDAG